MVAEGRLAKIKSMKNKSKKETHVSFKKDSNSSETRSRLNSIGDDNVFAEDNTTEKSGDNIETDTSVKIDLDSISVTSERLSHLTANRSSLPKQSKKRRLPSRYSQR